MAKENVTVFELQEPLASGRTAKACRCHYDTDTEAFVVDETDTIEVHEPGTERNGPAGHRGVAELRWVVTDLQI